MISERAESLGRNRPTGGRSASLTLRRVVVLVSALALTGCEASDDRLLVATSWPRVERERAARQFREHWKAQGRVPAQPPAIEWLVLDPDADPKRLLDRDRPPDVVLGLDEAELARLAGMGALDGPQDRPIRASRPILRGHVDPREVAGSMARLGDNRPLYVELIRLAAGLDPIPTSTGGRHLEPVVVLASTRKLEPARDFVKSITDYMNTIGRDRYEESLALAASFLAIMLESIVIDARDELTLAGRALERSGRPAGALAWLVEPPPWPPASVAKLLARPDQSGDELVLRLAESIVPDPSRRDALVRSWLEPPRPIDGALAIKLAALSEGSLLQEPRLRDWLRAEWTAWARQRFRRVARLAAGWTAKTPDPGGAKSP